MQVEWIQTSVACNKHSLQLEIQLEIYCGTAMPVAQAVTVTVCCHSLAAGWTVTGSLALLYRLCQVTPAALAGRLQL